MKCANCKNAVMYVGAYTKANYVECRFEQDLAENATIEQLKEWCSHPETAPKKEDYCQYAKGKPKFGGVTFDD